MEFLVRLLRLVIPHITPEIRNFIREVLNSLEDRVKKTNNPWDDLFVEIVKMVLFLNE